MIRRIRLYTAVTVVAAVLHKLAERSSDETKQISQRIAAIQQQITEVVWAMAVGGGKVEKSAGLGRRERIAPTVAATQRQVEGTIRADRRSPDAAGLSNWRISGADHPGVVDDAVDGRIVQRNLRIAVQQ